MIQEVAYFTFDIVDIAFWKPSRKLEVRHILPAKYIHHIFETFLNYIVYYINKLIIITIYIRISYVKYLTI